MTDFNNQNNTNSDQIYSPLTNDYDNPSNNIIPEPQIIQTNITPEENNLNNNSGEYIIYKTPYGSSQASVVFCFIIVIIFGVILALTSINNIDNSSVYLTILFPIFGLLLGCCITSSYYIAYDSSQKIIILTTEKLFKCIKNKQIIQINDIQKVIFKRYNNGEAGKYFKTDFRK